MSDIDLIIEFYGKAQRDFRAREHHGIDKCDDCRRGEQIEHSARLELAALREEVGRLKSERSDLLLLWRWGAGGKVGTGFAEVLGGDGDGETWAVRFDPMSPDDRAEFVVKITMGEDGLPVLDDAARAALAEIDGTPHA